MELQSKWALVGGASQGIGAAIAQIFAENGARVVLMSRDIDKLETVRKTLPHPENHVCLAIDLEALEKIAPALQNVMRSTGPIEIVVNNSGGPASGPLILAPLSDFVRSFGWQAHASETLFQNR